MDIDFLLRQKGGQVFSIGPSASLRQCVDRLNEKRVGALIVLEEHGELAGIISERDILHAIDSSSVCLDDVYVRDVMTPLERLITAKQNESIEAVMELMTNNRIRHLPIVDDGNLLGIVSIGDIVKGLLDATTEENRMLKEYMSGTYS